MTTLSLSPTTPQYARGLRLAEGVALGVFALALGASGLLDLVQPTSFQEAITRSGYPAHFFSILGFWKVAGVLALVVPCPARIKEWASAGFFFALTGATASHVLGGDPLGDAAPAVVLLTLGATSYALRARRTAVPRP